MKEGEIWVYVPPGYEEPEDPEIPNHASLYLVTRITQSSIFLLDLRNGREVPYYDTQEDDLAHGWRRMKSDGST